MKVTNDVFSKFFTEKATIHNKVYSYLVLNYCIHWNKRPPKYARKSDREQISKT